MKITLAWQLRCSECEIKTRFILRKKVVKLSRHIVERPTHRYIMIKNSSNANSKLSGKLVAFKISDGLQIALHHDFQFPPRLPTTKTTKSTCKKPATSLAQLKNI